MNLLKQIVRNQVPQQIPIKTHFRTKMTIISFIHRHPHNTKVSLISIPISSHSNRAQTKIYSDQTTPQNPINPHNTTYILQIHSKRANKHICFCTLLTYNLMKTDIIILRYTCHVYNKNKNTVETFIFVAKLYFWIIIVSIKQLYSCIPDPSMPISSIRIYLMLYTQLFQL